MISVCCVHYNEKARKKTKKSELCVSVFFSPPQVIIINRIDLVCSCCSIMHCIATTNTKFKFLSNGKWIYYMYKLDDLIQRLIQSIKTIRMWFYYICKLTLPHQLKNFEVQMNWVNRKWISPTHINTEKYQKNKVLVPSEWM